MQLTHGQRESLPSAQKDRSVTPAGPGLLCKLPMAMGHVAVRDPESSGAFNTLLAPLFKFKTTSIFSNCSWKQGLPWLQSNGCCGRRTNEV